MALYCDIDDILDDITENELAKLSNPSDPESVDFTLVSRKIKGASDWIDGFLRDQYPLPLENEHEILKKVAVETVLYEFYKRAGKAENHKELYTNSVKTMESLQRGKIRLDEQDGDADVLPSHVAVLNQEKIFSDTTLDNASEMD